MLTVSFNRVMSLQKVALDIAAAVISPREAPGMTGRHYRKSPTINERRFGKEKKDEG